MSDPVDDELEKITFDADEWKFMSAIESVSAAIRILNEKNRLLRDEIGKLNGRVNRLEDPHRMYRDDYE